MCTKSQLNIITSTVAEEAKCLLGDKLDAVILYGSYARGDYDDESDIDIMIIIDCDIDSLEEYRKLFIKLVSRLSLEYGIEISLVFRDLVTFNKFKDALPFYKNVDREGIKIAL